MSWQGESFIVIYKSWEKKQKHPFLAWVDKDVLGPIDTVTHGP